ncbi:MAG: hypothetical protein JXB00_09080 [Bacteroidales bacterium]|nr:hypothetical protein [Bacteroidales bacterium]
MKKTLMLSTALLLATVFLYGGGIVTNTNQSASWVRMPARNATLGIDATYYNPAGLSFLPSNGFFVSLNNQVIGQTRTITSSYPLLNESKYTGDVSAPLFPSIYAGYKTERFAVSFGFLPIGGGGGATYNTGVPSFEYPLTDLVPAFALAGVNDYRADIFFEGSSVFFGYQLGFTYKINDVLSVALGGRYITAKETYKGHLKDIEIYNYSNSEQWTRADVVMTGIASSATTSGTNLQAAIDGGLLQATDPASLTVIGGLAQLGINATGYTNAQAVTAFQTAAAQFTTRATVLGDQEADAKKTGSGITPFISINFHPSEKLNIAAKYEHNTKLELKNETSKDITVGFTPTGTPITQFPDGATARLDIPGTISLGAAYRPIEKLLVSAGFYYYLDKSADWEGREDSLDANGFEIVAGLEYNISEKLLVSGGYLFTKPGTTPAYNNDLSFNVQSSTIGLGLAYKVNDMVEVELGGSYTIYKDGEKSFIRNTVPFSETYDKGTWIAGIGVNFYFGK